MVHVLFPYRDFINWNTVEFFINHSQKREINLINSSTCHFGWGIANRRHLSWVPLPREGETMSSHELQADVPRKVTRKWPFFSGLWPAWVVLLGMAKRDQEEILIKRKCCRCTQMQKKLNRTRAASIAVIILLWCFVVEPSCACLLTENVQKRAALQSRSESKGNLDVFTMQRSTDCHRVSSSHLYAGPPYRKKMVENCSQH